MSRPGQLPGRASVINGELQAGGNILCLCLTGVLLWSPPPPEGRPEQLRSLSWFISYRHLEHKCQHSLSAVTLGIYLCGYFCSLCLGGGEGMGLTSHWRGCVIIPHLHQASQKADSSLMTERTRECVGQCTLYCSRRLPLSETNHLCYMIGADRDGDCHTLYYIFSPYRIYTVCTCTYKHRLINNFNSD